jgi:hypothetical protein
MNRNQQGMIEYLQEKIRVLEGFIIKFESACSCGQVNVIVKFSCNYPKQGLNRWQNDRQENHQRQDIKL